ncbi:MAG: hypothetical protein AABZ47_07900 [Planctomycetota bacterium]
MNEEIANAMLIKRARKEILRSLRLFYPSDINLRSLQVSVADIEEHHLKVDLSYLIDKGYVVWTNREPNQNWKDRNYRITAAGMERLDKIVVDPALEP